MIKGFGFKLILAITLLIPAVFWVLSLVPVEPFEVFNASWAIFIVAGIWGIMFILKGLFEKNITYIKKLSIFLGAGLLVIALFACVNLFAIEDKLIIPIICVIAAAALVISLIAVGGKKWDTGDNQKVGYKNYYQRKAEEEERERKENK